MTDSEIFNHKEDKEALNRFIAGNREYVARVAGHILNRYVDQAHDDAYSIALQAFYEAIIRFEPHKGTFRTFAYQVIRSRLYDFGRKTYRHDAHEVLTDENTELSAYLRMSIDHYETLTHKEEVQLEIMSLSHRLKDFDITFHSLYTLHPKAKKTLHFFNALFDYEDLCRDAYHYLLDHNRLNIKVFEGTPDFNRKRLERHRNYFISKLIIYFEDYPNIKSFIDWS